MAAAGVIIAVAGRDEAAIAAAVDAHPRLAVARRCADLAEATGAAAAGVGMVVLVSDQPRLTRATVASLVATGALVVGLPTGLEAGEQLRALGMPTVLDHGLEPQDAAHAVAAQLGQSPTPAPSPRSEDVVRDAAGTVIAVWGPAGAPGRTTVAVNLAAEVARAGRSVLVVDADTYGGAVAQAVGLTDELPGIAGAVREAQHGTVDAAIIGRHARSLGDGWAVLTGITRPQRWTELPGVAVEEVLRGARAFAHVVIVDCGFSLEADEALTYDTSAPQRNGATLAAIAQADQVLAVGSAEPLGLQRLIHGLETLDDLARRPPVVVANRVRAEVAGSRPQEAVADLLARYARVERTWTLPWDPAACDAATATGQVLAEAAPRSRLRKAFVSLAAGILPAPNQAPSPRRPRSVVGSVGH